MEKMCYTSDISLLQGDDKNQERGIVMKRKLIYKLAVLLCVLLIFCSACTRNENISVKEDDGIAGTWLINEEGSPICFFDDGTVLGIWVYDNGTHQEYIYMMYRLSKDCLSIVDQAGNEEEWSITSKTENHMILELQDGTQRNLSRIAANTNLNSISGDWEALSLGKSVNYSFGGSFVDISSLCFFNDGTYMTKGGYQRRGEYLIVHDGATIQLDGRYYWDYEFVCPGIMALELADGVRILYVACSDS